MKTFGIKETQELTSLNLDEEGNPKLDMLKPREAPEDWVPPVIIPLVKLSKPTDYDGTKFYPVPKIVWYDDRVERDWELVAIPPGPVEDIVGNEAREAAQQAAALKLAMLTAPFQVTPEGFSLATSESDQNAFSRLLTLLNVANTSDDFKTTIADVQGNLQTITFGRFKQIMISYGLEIHHRWIKFKQ